jgi:hypothetical protein
MNHRGPGLTLTPGESASVRSVRLSGLARNISRREIRKRQPARRDIVPVITGTAGHRTGCEQGWDEAIYGCGRPAERSRASGEGRDERLEAVDALGVRRDAG